MSIEIKYLGTGEVLFTLAYCKPLKKWIIREKLPKSQLGPPIFLDTDSLMDWLDSDPYIDAELIPATQNPHL